MKREILPHYPDRTGRPIHDDDFGFVRRELARVRAAMEAADPASELFLRLYDVQQALMWTLDPLFVAAPYQTIMRQSGRRRDGD